MIEGNFPPIPTPFENGHFAPERMAQNLERWAMDPLEGYVVLGSNGEAPLLPRPRRSAAPGRRSTSAPRPCSSGFRATTSPR
jgi:hypothetical protein